MSENLANLFPELVDGWGNDYPLILYSMLLFPEVNSDWHQWILVYILSTHLTFTTHAFTQLWISLLGKGKRVAELAECTPASSLLETDGP